MDVEKSQENEAVISEDPLDSWSEGAAFGVSEDKDEICEIPVEEWIQDVKMESTADVPIPTKLVDRVIGQEAASIVIRKAA